MRSETHARTNPTVTRLSHAVRPSRPPIECDPQSTLVADIFDDSDLHPNQHALVVAADHSFSIATLILWIWNRQWPLRNLKDWY